MAFDVHEPGFLRDPSEGIRALRAEGPLVRARLPVLGEVWMTTTDAAARRVLKDEAIFKRNSVNAGGRPLTRTFWWFPPFLRPLLTNITLQDGEDHARLRRLVSQAFSRGRIDEITPWLQGQVDALLAPLPEGEPVDLVPALARKLPHLAICELLGLPEADRDRIDRWVRPISRATGFLSFYRAGFGLWRLSRYLRADFDRVRRTPRPGLIRDLVEARDGTDRLNDDELLAMVVAIFVGGYDTTVHLIANGLLQILTDPETAARLRADPALWPLFIEEVMRFHSPVMFTNMYHVAEPTEIEGHRLNRGDRVVPLLIAANRDPDRFEDEDTFETGRKPNSHLGFGAGLHICLGMQLARAEARAVLETVAGRYPEARLAVPPEVLPRLRRLGLRGLPRLPVVLGPAR